MNGAHDLGGMHGFGPIRPETDEPLFHAPWEARILALQRAMAFTRTWHVDNFRDAQERLPAGVYFSVGYYHRWLLAMQVNVVEHGLVTQDELEQGHMVQPGPPVMRTLHRPDVPAACARGSFSRPPVQPPRFAPGDRVRTRNLNPPGHTRLPRYVRNHVGVVEAVRGCHVYPDSLVATGNDDPQWLYTVVFEAPELWGEGADPLLKISVEAFELYLVEP